MLPQNNPSFLAASFKVCRWHELLVNRGRFASVAQHLQSLSGVSLLYPCLLGLAGGDAAELYVHNVEIRTLRECRSCRFLCQRQSGTRKTVKHRAAWRRRMRHAAKAVATMPPWLGLAAGRVLRGRPSCVREWRRRACDLRASRRSAFPSEARIAGHIWGGFRRAGARFSRTR
jgi:hypothetical protein